ncbi:universal stress protein [Chloroflexota bacterium]
MLWKILVPLDGSQLAEITLPYVEEMAARLDSEVTLLSVSESKESHDYYQQEVYIQRTADETNTNARNHHEKPKDKDVKVDAAILTGDPSEEILQYASEQKFNLIVMATHGQSGMIVWNLGTVAKRVLRATTRPVLLIRAKNVHPDIRKRGILHRILVPLDGSKESEAVVPYVEDLTSKLGAEVVLFHVAASGMYFFTDQGASTVPQAGDKVKKQERDAVNYLTTVANKLKEKGIRVNFEVRYGRSPAEEIIKYRREIYADMVAMSSHGRAGVKRWALGSVTDKVLDAGYAHFLLVKLQGVVTK